MADKIGIPLNIFIDTNILLDFYRLSSGDLEELRKIAKLSKAGKIRLLVSDYVKDEYYRNREGVINSAVEQFKKSRIELHLPNLVKVYSTALELRTIKDTFESKKGVLISEVYENIANASLMADSVIEDLFASTEIHSVSAGVINAGVERSTHARPPGKRESCGDAVHWEWLLTILPVNEDLIIISADKDYESPLHPGNLSNYLRDEWKEKKRSECILYSSLTAFLTDLFPDIKLADEVDKVCAIEQLEASYNFKTTHEAISRLTQFDDFSEAEILRLVKAYNTNDQVSRILGDDDIRDFAIKLCNWAIEAELHEEVEPLVELLEKLEPTESGSK